MKREREREREGGEREREGGREREREREIWEIHVVFCHAAELMTYALRTS